jgi:hypothetical protein
MLSPIEISTRKKKPKPCFITKVDSQGKSITFVNLESKYEVVKQVLW